MKLRALPTYFFAMALLGAFSPVYAQTTTPSQMTITPVHVMQGEPVMITLPSVASLSKILKASITIDGIPSPIYFTIYKNTPTAVYGTDITAATGTADILVTLKDGSSLSGSFPILTREKYELPLPVPEKLGGNSATNTTRIVSVLSKENAQIAKIKSVKNKAFWTSTFAYPLHGQILVTDPYGYLRDTGNGTATITHKGTDFHATIGTPVYAINDGTIALAKTFTVYGKTIIIDHGLGIESLYMHLSKIKVSPGARVKKGTLIGYSGDTGYAEAAHLHVSIKINGISIDPMKFFDLFNPQQI